MAFTQGLDTIFHGLDEQNEKDYAYRNTAIEIESMSWNKTVRNLHIYVKNVGSTTLKAEKTSVLVNGIDASQKIVLFTVDGKYTNVWAPMDTLHLNLTNIQNPKRVTVITNNGVKAYAIPGLHHIVVTPSYVNVPAGGTQVFFAYGYDFNDEPVDINSTISWSTNVGTMSGSMLNAQTTPGSGYVNASVGNIVGSAIVNVTPAPLHHIVVLPSPVDVPAGGTQVFTAQGYDIFNNPVSITPAWSTNVGVMVGSTLIARQTPTGTGNVWATVGSIVGSAVVNIVPASLHHIVVSPDDANVPVGSSLIYTAVGYDIYNNPININPVWTTNVGYMQGSTFYAQTTPADGLVTATVGSISDSATVHVIAGALNHIHVEPIQIDVPAGGTYTFTAIGHDAFHNVVPITPVWSTDVGSMAGNVFTAQNTVGTGFVNASVGSIVGSAQVNVIPANLHHIVVTPNPVSLLVGENQSFTATGYDIYGNTVPINPIWSTDVGTMVGSTLYASTLPCVGNVTASVGTISDSASVTVQAGPLDHIHVIPSYLDLPAGGSYDFDAIGHDRYDNIVPITPTWSATIGTINALGVFTAPNTVTSGIVTASVGSIVGSAQVNVIPANLASIVVTPSSQDVPAGGNFVFTATGYDIYGNIVSINPIWSTDVGYMQGSTFYAQTSVGIGNVTATLGAISGQASVNIIPGPLHHIKIIPSEATVAAGNSKDFDAIGYDMFDNVVSITPVWSTNVGTINGAGTLTAQNTLGSGFVEASVGAISAQANVTVVANSLDHVIVTPDPATVTVGSSLLFTAQGYDAYNNPVDILPVWSTNVGTMVGNVLYACTYPISGTVTATVGAISDSAFVTVVVGPVAHYHVNPAAGSKYAGFPFQVTIVAHDQYHNVVTTDSTTIVSFASTSPTMVFSTNGGISWGATSVQLTNGQANILARDTTAGTSTISAFEDGHSGVSEPITILPGTPSLVTITSPASPITVSADLHTVTISCEVRDTYGNLVSDGTEVTWTYTGSSSIISPTYTTNGLTSTTLTTSTIAGSVYTVTATCIGGSDTSPTITVVPGSPAKINSTSPINPTTVSADTPSLVVSFYVTDIWNNAIDGIQVNFTSSGLVSPDSAFTIAGHVSTTLTTSTHAGDVFFVTASCNEHSADSQPITVVAGKPAVITFLYPTSALSVSADVHQVLIQVSVEDAHGNPVPDGTIVTFTINDPGLPNSGLGSIASPISTIAGVASTTFITSTFAGDDFNITASSGTASSYSETITVVPGASVKLVFTTSPQTNVKVGENSSICIVTIQDQYGNNVTLDETTTLTIVSSSATTEFSLDCITWGITSVTINAGSSNASFYFRDTNVGTFTITVYETPSHAWIDATQIEEVIP